MRRGAIRCSAACRQRRAAGERLNGKSVVVCCMTSRTRVGREGRRQVDRSAGGRGQVGCGSEGPSGSRNQSDGKLKRHGRDPVACYWAGGSVCSVSVALRCVSFVSASGPVNPAAVRSPGIPAGLVLVPLCRLFLVLPFLFFFLRFVASSFKERLPKGREGGKKWDGCAGGRGCSGKRGRSSSTGTSKHQRAAPCLVLGMSSGSGLGVWVRGRQGLEMRAGARCPLLAPLDGCIGSGEGGATRTPTPRSR